jgi:GNAT superfamily N-acetyltransferase
LAELGVTVESWSAQVRNQELTGIICEDNGQMAGYCFGDLHSGEIVVLALLPAYEGQGIGRQLMHAVMLQLRHAGHQRLFLGCNLILPYVLMALSPPRLETQWQNRQAG